jgi:hypothetical protein
MPFWLPSSLNVSQRSSVPSGDGIPHGLKSAGSCPSMSRYVPSSGLMIREPPPGSAGDPQIAMWAPSENQCGHSPVSVDAWTSRSCACGLIAKQAALPPQPPALQESLIRTWLGVKLATRRQGPPTNTPDAVAHLSGRARRTSERERLPGAVGSASCRRLVHVERRRQIGRGGAIDPHRRLRAGHQEREPARG